MKFAWPESQKRVILEVREHGFGGVVGWRVGGVATVGVAWAFCVAAADGDAGC